MLQKGPAEMKGPFCTHTPKFNNFHSGNPVLPAITDKLATVANYRKFVKRIHEDLTFLSFELEIKHL